MHISVVNAARWSSLKMLKCTNLANFQNIKIIRNMRHRWQLIKAEIPYTRYICECDIAVSMRFRTTSPHLLTRFPWNWRPGLKFQDSTVRFTFARMATWNDTFCLIHKSHTQSHINISYGIMLIVYMFSISLSNSYSHNAYRAYIESRLNSSVVLRN